VRGSGGVGRRPVAQVEREHGHVRLAVGAAPRELARRRGGGGDHQPGFVERHRRAPQRDLPVRRDADQQRRLRTMSHGRSTAGPPRFFLAPDEKRANTVVPRTDPCCNHRGGTVPSRSRTAMTSVTAEFDDFGYALLRAEAERQGVSPEDLLAHAALYYLADADSGRAAHRVLPSDKLEPTADSSASVNPGSSPN
jgi:hypothetical protein